MDEWGDGEELLDALIAKETYIGTAVALSQTKASSRTGV